MTEGSFNENKVDKRTDGAAIQQWISALFFSTNFNNVLQEPFFKHKARPPPHFDLISNKFKSEVRKNGL